MAEHTISNESMLPIGSILRSVYRIDRYLSSGGFGNTYVATNIEFNERYAIKEFFMRGVTQRDDNQTTVSVSNTENRNAFIQQREKFKKEARRIRQLKNEHIISVFDLFEENGTAYYVMDYVDGENLSDRLKRTGHPMTESEVRRILPQILDALKAVHDADIWHLDLKPANIMMDKAGNIKLIDFGASKQLDAQKGGATTSTTISYTNGYAPREQMEQNYEKFGPWTDLYALGATLYNLITNRRPPLPSDIDDDMSEDKHESLPMPASVSDWIKGLILRLMQSSRMKRPKSVDELLGFLKELSSTDNNQNNSSSDLSSNQTKDSVEKEEKTILGPITQSTNSDKKDERIIDEASKDFKKQSSAIRKAILTSIGVLGVILFIVFSNHFQSAPTLVGEWQSDSVITEKDNTISMSWKMHLKADGTMDNKVSAEMNGEEEGFKIHFPFGMSFSGTWKADDKELTMLVDSTSFKPEFKPDSVIIEATDKETAAMVGTLKTKMTQTLEKQMNDPNGDFFKGLKKENDTLIYELTAKELKLVSKKDSGGTPQVFERIK